MHGTKMGKTENINKKTTIKVGDPSTHNWQINTQWINKNLVDLNDTISQVNLIEIYRLLHMMTTESTFVWSLHGVFCKTDYLVGHKIYTLDQIKRVEVDKVEFF